MYTKEHQQLLNKYKANNTPTIYENILAELLDKLQIRYIRQKGFLAKAYTCYIADFYLPRPYKYILEVDGKYHENRQYTDKCRDEYFMHKRGIVTIRFNNEELVNNLDNIEQYLLSIKRK